MTDPTAIELVRYMLMWPPDMPPIIGLVVDDSEDDALVKAIAEEDGFPSQHFGGLWGAGPLDGYWSVAFHLIQLGGGLERAWWTDNIHRPFLETIVDVPHLVAITPLELAGDIKEPEGFVQLIGGSLLVQVDDHSPQVQQVLDERRDD